eukprot:6078630-Pleurochrysis_carterae.AAC.1
MGRPSREGQANVLQQAEQTEAGPSGLSALWMLPGSNYDQPSELEGPEFYGNASDTNSTHATVSSRLAQLSVGVGRRVGAIARLAAWASHILAPESFEEWDDEAMTPLVVILLILSVQLVGCLCIWRMRVWCRKRMVAAYKHSSRTVHPSRNSRTSRNSRASRSSRACARSISSLAGASQSSSIQLRGGGRHQAIRISDDE